MTGRGLLAVAVAGFGILNLSYGNMSPIWASVPAWLPWPEVWCIGTGTVLLVAGVGLFFARFAWLSALGIAAYESVWLIARTPPVWRKPLDVGSWYGFDEALGPLVAAWLLYWMLRGRRRAPTAGRMTGGRAHLLARMVFGSACMTYGAAHFAYASYTASMIPAWLPAHLALAYLTGAAHAAAGIALVFGVVPRLAASLEGLMMSLFGVLVWLPSFFAKPVPEWASPAQNRWSETLLSFLLAASAWIVAASVAAMTDRPVGRASRARCYELFT